MSTIKEDGTSMLTDSAAQDYIHELESKVKVLSRSKANILEVLNEYQSEQGFNLVAKDFLLTMLTDDEVVNTIIDEVKDGVLDGLPDLNDYDDRLYELENKPDEYEIIDTVVESMTFESKVEEIVNERLQEINFKVIVEDDR